MQKHTSEPKKKTVPIQECYESTCVFFGLPYGHFLLNQTVPSNLAQKWLFKLRDKSVIWNWSTKIGTPCSNSLPITLYRVHTLGAGVWRVIYLNCSNALYSSSRLVRNRRLLIQTQVTEPDNLRLFDGCNIINYFHSHGGREGSDSVSFSSR